VLLKSPELIGYDAPAGTKGNVKWLREGHDGYFCFAYFYGGSDVRYSEEHNFQLPSRMKNLQIIAIITLFLVSISATCNAQNRDARSRSAQAAYGHPAEFKASKKKAKKQKKSARRKAKAPLHRKKSPWVN
jgi:hypothetical protein